MSDPTLLAALRSGQLLYADLYTLTLRDGTIGRYTAAQQDVLVPQTGTAGLLFRARDVLISGLRCKSSVGLSVDEQTLAISYRPDSLLAGQPWPIALRDGLLGGGRLRRDRVFFRSWGQPPISNVMVPLFAGRVSTIASLGRVEARISVKSDLVLLDIDMPRNLWAPGCGHALFDAGCGLDRGGYAVQGTAADGSTPGAIVWSGAVAGRFDQGTIRFETGANRGASRSIQASDGSRLILAYPFDRPVKTGDSFVAYWGCAKVADLDRILITGQTVAGTAAITHPSSAGGIFPGMGVSGPGIAAHTTVTGVTDSSIQLSAAPTTSVSNGTFTFAAIASPSGCKKFANINKFRGFPFVPRPDTAV